MESLLHFDDVFSLLAGQFHLVLGHEQGRFLLVRELLLELLLFYLLFDDGQGLLSGVLYSLVGLFLFFLEESDSIM